MNIYEVIEKIKDMGNSPTYVLGAVKICKRDEQLIIDCSGATTMVFNDKVNSQFEIEGACTFQEILDHPGKVSVHKEGVYKHPADFLDNILFDISLVLSKSEELKSIFTEKVWFKA